jgi:hypothetical protein
MAPAWGVLGVAATVWCGVASSQQNHSGHALSMVFLYSGLALAVVWLTLLVGCSYVLARSRRWVYLWVLTGGAWFLGIALYVVGMVTAPPTEPTDTNDIAAGVGILILGVPLLLVIGIIVAVGVGASTVVGHVSQRRTEPAPAG